MSNDALILENKVHLSSLGRHDIVFLKLHHQRLFHNYFSSVSVHIRSQVIKTVDSVLELTTISQYDSFPATPSHLSCRNPWVLAHLRKQPFRSGWCESGWEEHRKRCLLRQASYLPPRDIREFFAPPHMLHDIFRPAFCGFWFRSCPMKDVKSN